MHRIRYSLSLCWDNEFRGGTVGLAYATCDEKIITRQGFDIICIQACQMTFLPSHSNSPMCLLMHKLIVWKACPFPQEPAYRADGPVSVIRSSGQLAPVSLGCMLLNAVYAAYH